MTDTESNQFKFIAEYAECIANAANNWAHLEYYINSTIWSLSNMEPSVGACITSQIFSMNARLDAIVALLKLRKADGTIIKRLNRFIENVRNANECRNRIIHDVWLNDRQTPQHMGRLTITAKRSLEFSVQTVPLLELQNDLAEISRMRKEFSEIRKLISGALSSLPEMSQTELRPINETPTGQ